MSNYYILHPRKTTLHFKKGNMTIPPFKKDNSPFKKDNSPFQERQLGNCTIQER